MTALVVYLQNTIANLRERQEGQTMAEYALILGGIAVVVIAAIVFLGGRIDDLFKRDGLVRHEPGRRLVGHEPRSCRGGLSDARIASERPPRVFRGGSLPNDSTRTGLEEDGDRADDGTAAILRAQSEPCGIIGRDPGRGNGDETTDRREAGRRSGDDRVRADPARVHAHRRRAARASAASSSTGSRRTTSPTRPRAGRSSTETPTRRQTLQQYAATSAGGDSGVRERREGLHRLPGQDPDVGRPRRPDPREGPEAVLAHPVPQRRRRSRSGARRRCGPNGSTTTSIPRTSDAQQHRDVLMNSSLRRRARRRDGARRGDDPGVPPAHGARGRRGRLVHAQAPAPESRRRGRVFRRHRVPEELEGLRPERRPRAQAGHGAEDRERRAPVRG